MPVVHSIDVALAEDEILDRLPLSSTAFSARPAPALVAELLDQIEQDQLLTAQACYDIHGIEGIDSHCIEVDGRSLRIKGVLPGEIDGAERLIFAAWTLGPGMSSAVSKAFDQRRYLAGFLLHEIASIFLFRLGEKLFEQLSGQDEIRKRHIGRAFAPGDDVFDLSIQGTVLALSGAGRIGVKGGVDGPMFPLKSATAIAPVGYKITHSGSRWSCKRCRARDHCRLRSGSTENRGHERLD